MTLPYDETDSRSIERYAKRLIGRTLRSVLDKATFDMIVRNVQNRGEMGQVLERYYFMYEPNQRDAPDFPKAGLELKSTPLKRLRDDSLRAKERLVLNIIDFMNEPKKEWEQSSFLRKNRSLLLMFYIYEEGRFVLDLLFQLVGIWEFPPEDLRIIKNDWETIVNKVRAGKAHELSESDTLYLAACVKGSGHERNNRPQPCSQELAKQRAFSLKARYMNTIIDCWTGVEPDPETEPIVKNVAEYVGEETFEQLVLRRFRPYLYHTIDDIHSSLGLQIDPSAKNYYATVTMRILGVMGKKAEEFEKADIIIRTVRLKHSGMPKEAISFPYFKYKELVEEDWETSTLRSTFERRFFFVIYKYDADGGLVLRKVVFWNMPFEHRENEVRRVWQRTVDLIKAGKADALPGITESPICHVRPHAKDSSDTDEAPDGRSYVKKCFWLNQSYIKEQLTGDILD
jgi:DNA mismatch repair protein MutH